MTDTALTRAEFDYGQYESKVATELRQMADSIRVRGQDQVDALIEIGNLLANAKDKVGHGSWGPWLSAEFSMSTSTAERYMRAAKFAADKNVMVTNLSSSTLYLLSAKSTPSSLVDEFLDSITSAEPVSESELKHKLTLLKQSKQPETNEPLIIPETRERVVVPQAQSQESDETDPGAAAVLLLRLRLGDDFLRFIDLWKRAGEAFESALTEAASMISSEGSKSHGR